MSSRVNHLAVLVAAIAFFIISWLWYSLIFGTMYMAQIAQMTGKSTAMASGSAMLWPLVETFLLGWFLAYVIGTALSMRPDPNPAARGFGFGLFIGIGVFASMTLMGVVWGGMTLGLWLINAGFIVVAMAIMGWIIGAMSAKSATATV
ncbi:MAG TPA: DUF1761 domain-containing protein [Candidatus Rubrimentiphilum sp.]|nr:DUF1761 domain-containing protein [Candidatus Rubrimentiphilum sp.]